MDDKTMMDARKASSSDPKADAALKFAQKLIINRGTLSDGDVQDLKSAGFTDGDITEIIANVVLTIFTDYINHGLGTPVDFPQAPPLS